MRTKIMASQYQVPKNNRSSSQSFPPAVSPNGELQESPLGSLRKIIGHDKTRQITYYTLTTKQLSKGFSTRGSSTICEQSVRWTLLPDWCCVGSAAFQVRMHFSTILGRNRKHVPISRESRGVSLAQKTAKANYAHPLFYTKLAYINDST